MKCEDCVYYEMSGGYIDLDKRKVITLYWCERRNKTCKDMREFKLSEPEGENE